MFHHLRHHLHRHAERRFARDPLGGGDHGHHHHHRHGRRGRPFDHGELRFIVLRLIAEQPRHGYEIIKAIESAFGGTYSPSPGVIYPTLTLLEELGHASVEEQAGKKRYAVTEAGRAFLEANSGAAAAAMARMDEAREAMGGGPPAPIFRAIHNLKLAVNLRLGRGPLNDEQVRRIAETLDAAAAAIEQI